MTRQEIVKDTPSVVSEGMQIYRGFPFSDPTVMEGAVHNLCS
jgi:hypothetical protein